MAHRVEISNIRVDDEHKQLICEARVFPEVGKSPFDMLLVHIPIAAIADRKRRYGVMDYTTALEVICREHCQRWLSLPIEEVEAPDADVLRMAERVRGDGRLRAGDDRHLSDEERRAFSRLRLWTGRQTRAQWGGYRRDIEVIGWRDDGRNVQMRDEPPN
jgi:hypothetical protein